MRQIREILRLHWSQGLSMRSIAQSLGVSYGSVHEVVRRATAAALPWPLPPGLDDEALARALYAGNQGRPRVRPEPDWLVVNRELRRKGVTLQLLWLEYKQTHPEGLQYTQFCQHFARWQATQDVVLRQTYRAGEKMFVDYAGPALPIVNPRTGEIHRASLFVAALGASSMTFLEANEDRTLPRWISGNTHAVEYFHGVAAAVVCDNFKDRGGGRVLVRAGAEPDVCGLGRTLQHGDPPHAPGPSKGQRQSRSRGAPRRAVGPRSAPRPDVHERGGMERGDGPPAGSTQ